MGPRTKERREKKFKNLILFIIIYLGCEYEDTFYLPYDWYFKIKLLKLFNDLSWCMDGPLVLDWLKQVNGPSSFQGDHSPNCDQLCKYQIF